MSNVNSNQISNTNNDKPVAAYAEDVPLVDAHVSHSPRNRDETDEILIDFTATEQVILKHLFIFTVKTTLNSDSRSLAKRERNAFAAKACRGPL